mgnify:CR=1 FL=1
MSKGRVLPAESRWLADPTTGRRIRQVTSHPSIHHHPFFFVPPWDDAMRRLVFVSHRTGTPQLYAEEDGRFVQLTDCTGLGAVYHSVAHLEGHAQEVIYITRLRLGDRYRFKDSY